MYSTDIVHFILAIENNLQMQNYYIGPLYLSKPRSKGLQLELAVIKTKAKNWCTAV